MSNRSGHEDFLLILLAAGLVIGAAVYALVLFWPYLIFYVLPFVAASLAVGGVLRMATLPAENGLYNYRGLRAAYPVMILLVAVVFFAGSERAIVLDGKGHVTGTYLDWPNANKAFNEERSSAYTNSFFKSLKERARYSVVYDRQEIGWIALWSLFLGGPLFFLYLGNGDSERDEKVLGERLLEQTKLERNRLMEKAKGLDETIAKSQVALKTEISALKREKEGMLKEMLVLQARAEFSDVPRPSESQKGSGVLDSDIL